MTGISPTHGPLVGGISITMFASALGTDDVTFASVGERSANVLAQTVTSVTVILPPRPTAGIVDVVATSDILGSSTGYNMFRYNDRTCDAIASLILQNKVIDASCR
jgi:hypothetical protein